MTSRFLYHKACEKCGSKDNRGVWDDGHEFCFGCKDYISGGNPMYSKSQLKRLDHQQAWGLPDDCTTIIGEPASTWLFKYRIDPFLSTKYNILWSPQRMELIFPFYRGKYLIGYQARTFRDNKPKYITRANPEEFDKYVYTLPGSVYPSTWVIVEDVISAIKVHLAGFTSIALLGSYLKKPIRDFILIQPTTTEIITWLDPDKFFESKLITRQMKDYGYERSYTVNTPGKDPKDHTENSIINTIVATAPR